MLRRPSGPNARVRMIGSSDERPLMGVLRILTAKIRKELAGLGLKVEGQGSGKQISLFKFNFGFVVLVELENDIAEAFEVRVNRAVHRNFRVAKREPAIDGIMIAVKL